MLYLRSRRKEEKISYRPLGQVYLVVQRTSRIHPREYSRNIAPMECTLNIALPGRAIQDETRIFPKNNILCVLGLNSGYTVSVLGREEGYTVKYTPLPEGVPKAKPEELLKAKSYI